MKKFVLILLLFLNIFCMNKNNESKVENKKKKEVHKMLENKKEKKIITYDKFNKKYNYYLGININKRDGVLNNFILNKEKKLEVFLISYENNDSIKKLLNNLTEEESNIFGKIKDHISCQIDLKTRKITLSVEDQDPLVSATMAEQLRRKLQEFITRYRTSKSLRDLEYYTKLSRQAKAEYEKARQRYSSFSDANMDAILVSYNSKKDDLENEMQLKYNAYTALNTQMETARAKVQETTPAFTTIKEASVPLLPAGPKRMAFVAAMLILSWIVTAFYSCRDLFVNSFLHEE